MFGNFRQSLIAAAVALLVFTIADWFDAGVLREAQRRTAMTFDPGPFFDLMPVAHLLTAAGVVAVVLAAWWSRSLLVGVGFTLVGGFLVLLPATVWAFATSVNGAPPPAPEPIANALGNWYVSVSAGVTGAVFTVAAAVLLSGLAVIASVLREQRGGRAASSQPIAPEPQSEPA